MQINDPGLPDKFHHFLFFAEDLSADRIELDPSETAHAVAVLRLRPGDPLRLTDGRGCRGTGIYETVAGRKMSVHITGRTITGRQQPDIRLCIGLPDRDAFETLLPDATALGIARIVPVAAACCQKGWWNKDWEKHSLRFRRKMIVALKQSQSCHLPEITAPCSTAEAVNSAAETGGIVLVADTRGAPLGAIAAASAGLPITCFIGPPGGFSEEECALFTRHEFTLVKIAPARLRTELAATALCAQLIGRSL